MTFSTSGYIRGRLTPKGLSVAALQLAMCVLNTSGCMEPAPMSPKPPALLTAEASRQPLHHAIPPAMIGYSVPKSWLIRLEFNMLHLMYGDTCRCKYSDESASVQALRGEM